MGDRPKTTGMGSIPHAHGVTFRVWAPHARRVSVTGSFNTWDGGKHPLQPEENGCWYADVAEARAGDQYRFLLSTPTGEYRRIDPYAWGVEAPVQQRLAGLQRRLPEPPEYGRRHRGWRLRRAALPRGGFHRGTGGARARRHRGPVYE
jgi:1,4-alpha-glucan branching enzyme